MKHKVATHGFTLIEVAIVVASLTLLALFAFPIYSDYVKKNKVQVSLKLAETAKIAVNHYASDDIPLTSLWTPPTVNDAILDIAIHSSTTQGISLLSQGKPISMPAANPGEIIIVFSAKIAPHAQNQLILSPRRPDPNQASSNGHELPLDFSNRLPTELITWECNSAKPPAANRGSRGNLDAKLAPAECRA